MVMCVMKFLAILLATQILACFGQLAFPRFGSNNRLRCEIEKGIDGKCEEVDSCLRSGGIPSANRSSICKERGNRFICCRKPYNIANEVCRMWQSYWRQNNGQCIYEQPLIVGGEEAGVGQFPHIAIIGYEGRRSLQWICGGTLVSPHFVLTAAHCVLQFHQFVVRLGEHDIFRPDRSNISRLIGEVIPGIYGENEILFDQRNQAQTEQTVKVAEVIIHSEYDRYYHDIALLRLERPVVLTKRVLPACLPTVRTESFNNMEVTAAGWGRTRYNRPRLSRTLLKVKVPTIDRVTCWEQISSINSRLIPNGIISSQLCAGQSGKDTCKGDSGGPLVLQLSKDKSPCEHTVAGVVSFGPGCGVLGVYTRVSSYVDWIMNHIAPKVLPVG